MSRQRPGQRRYIVPSSGAAAKKMHIFGWKNFLAVLLCLVLCAGGGALLIFYNTVNAVNYQPIEALRLPVFHLIWKWTSAAGNCSTIP